MEGFEGLTIAARGIRKHYGGIIALDDVSLEVLPAEIHALVGENGAGKSTLVKIMTGPDAGRRRRPQFLARQSRLSLREARATRHRRRLPGAEPCSGATVLENMFLGRELQTGRGVLEGTMKRRGAGGARPSGRKSASARRCRC